MIEFAGLSIPDHCPMCGSIVREERRHHVPINTGERGPRGYDSPVLVVEFACGAIVNAHHASDGTPGMDWNDPKHWNTPKVSADTGCRAALREALSRAG